MVKVTLALKNLAIQSLSLEGTAKGLAKLRNIVAETCVAETNFAARETKNAFAWSQKHFCFPDTNFASATNVSQFSHDENNVD